jgi:transcriptional regulator with XRE-family HTH domain
MKNEEIGRRIHERRKALNISVVDIAAYTGLSKATIHRYENGEIQNIKLPVLETIASILNVNPLWLIGKSENMERMDGKTNDLCVELTKAIAFVKETPYLTCSGRPVTEIEKNMVINTLQLAKDFLDKGE